jgi:hypothetical protein
MRRVSIVHVVLCGAMMAAGCGEDSDPPAGAGGAAGNRSGGSGGGTGGGGGSGGSSTGTGGSASAGSGGSSTGGTGGTGTASGGASGDAATGSGGSGDAGGGEAGETGGAAPTFEGSHPACPNCKAIFDGKTLTGWEPVGAEKWTVDNGAILSTGASAGALITTAKYDKYRLIYSWQMLSTTAHQANMLVWCTSTTARYCGGVQFQPPGTDIWDYGPANTSLKGKAGLMKADVPKGAAGQCEMIVNSTAGTFKVACCPLGTEKTCKTTAVGNLNYGSPRVAGQLGWQAHNPDHKIRWWNVFLEENPTSDEFLTSK